MTQSDGMLDIESKFWDSKDMMEVTTLMNEDIFANMKNFDPNFVIALMPGYIYWKNRNSQYMGCNNNLAQISDLKSPEEIIGKTDFDFDWGENKAEQFIKDDQYVMSTQQTLIKEYQLPVKRMDGNYLYVRTDKMPFYNEKGDVVGVLAIAVDITDIKILENKLRAEKERVEKLSRAKSEFIRNMEHDIRTPLGGIYLIANNLAPKETDAEKKQYLSAVAQGAQELLNYCNNILDFSRMESGGLPILCKKFDLKKLVMGVIAIEKPAAQAKGLILKEEYAENLPKVVIGDGNRIQRILVNLISNAIKFTKTGYVEVRVKLAKLSEKTAIIQFLIQDTGVGIPKEQQEYIYERFNKLTPSNRGDKGYGLGLSIVKQMMADINGEIDVKSKLNNGSVFICTIPFNIPLIDELIFEGEE